MINEVNVINLERYDLFMPDECVETFASFKMPAFSSALLNFPSALRLHSKYVPLSNTKKYQYVLRSENNKIPFGACSMR